MALFFGLLVAFTVGLTEYFGRRSTAVGGVTGAGAAMQWWALIATIIAMVFMPSRFAWVDFALGRAFFGDVVRPPQLGGIALVLAGVTALALG